MFCVCGFAFVLLWFTAVVLCLVKVVVGLVCDLGFEVCGYYGFLRVWLCFSVVCLLVTGCLLVFCVVCFVVCFDGFVGDVCLFMHVIYCFAITSYCGLVLLAGWLFCLVFVVVVLGFC